MALKKILKENLVLTMGIALPVLLVILFFLTSVLPKSLAEPPQHDLLFSVLRYDYQTASPTNFDFVVRDGVLYAKVGKTDSQNIHRYHRRLVRYDAQTESVREIPYDLAGIADAPEGTEAPVEATAGLTIDPSSKAPDGYTFESASYSGGGLVSELFFGGYRNQGYRIVKGKAAYRIPSTFGDNYYAGNVQFIGWAVEK